MPRPRPLPVLVAAAVLAAGCSGDAVDLDAAEDALTDAVQGVVAEVGGQADTNLASEREPCQDDLLRDTGEERAAVSAAVNVGADRDPAEVLDAAAAALDERGLATEREGDQVVRATADTYGLEVMYVADTGLLRASGSTDCG